MSINTADTRVLSSLISTLKSPLSPAKKSLSSTAPSDTFHKTRLPASTPGPNSTAPKSGLSSTELSLEDTSRFLQESFPGLDQDVYFNLFINSGLSYVLWGSKPMAWIGGEEKPLWQALKNLAKAGVPLRDDFILLDADDLPQAKGTGFIINRRNLSMLLNDSPQLLDAWPKLKEQRTAEIITSVFETLNPVSREFLTKDETLGTLLGYGPNNASKWSRMQEGAAPARIDPDLRENTISFEEMRKSRETLKEECKSSKIHDTASEISELDTSPFKVKIPGFVAFDSSSETEELMTQYLADSFKIREYMALQRLRGPRKSNGELQTSPSDFILQLLLQNLFQLGPLPSYAGEYLDIRRKKPNTH